MPDQHEGGGQDGEHGQCAPGCGRWAGRGQEGDRAGGGLDRAELVGTEVSESFLDVTLRSRVSPPAGLGRGLLQPDRADPEPTTSTWSPYPSGAPGVICPARPGDRFIASSGSGTVQVTQR